MPGGSLWPHSRWGFAMDIYYFAMDIYYFSLVGEQITLAVTAGSIQWKSPVTSIYNNFIWLQLLNREVFFLLKHIFDMLPPFNLPMISQTHPSETKTYFQGFQIILRTFLFTDINVLFCFFEGLSLHEDFRLGYVNLWTLWNKKPTSGSLVGSLWDLHIAVCFVFIHIKRSVKREKGASLPQISRTAALLLVKA